MNYIIEEINENGVHSRNQIIKIEIVKITKRPFCLVIILYTRKKSDCIFKTLSNRCRC